MHNKPVHLKTSRQLELHIASDAETLYDFLSTAITTAEITLTLYPDAHLPIIERHFDHLAAAVLDYTRKANPVFDKHFCDELESLIQDLELVIIRLRRERDPLNAQ